MKAAPYRHLAEIPKATEPVVLFPTDGRGTKIEIDAKAMTMAFTNVDGLQASGDSWCVCGYHSGYSGKAEQKAHLARWRKHEAEYAKNS